MHRERTPFRWVTIGKLVGERSESPSNLSDSPHLRPRQQTRDIPLYRKTGRILTPDIFGTTGTDACQCVKKWLGSGEVIRND